MFTTGHPSIDNRTREMSTLIKSLMTDEHSALSQQWRDTHGPLFSSNRCIADPEWASGVKRELDEMSAKLIEICQKDAVTKSRYQQLHAERGAIVALHKDPSGIDWSDVISALDYPEAAILDDLTLARLPVQAAGMMADFAQFYKQLGAICVRGSDDFSDLVEAFLATKDIDVADLEYIYPFETVFSSAVS